MNGPDYTNRPQPWSWFIQDDPNPEPANDGTTEDES